MFDSMTPKQRIAYIAGLGITIPGMIIFLATANMKSWIPVTIGMIMVITGMFAPMVAIIRRDGNKQKGRKTIGERKDVK